MTSNLVNYNMEQLKKIAKTREIRGFSKLKKQELINRIRECILDKDNMYKFFKVLPKKEFNIFKKAMNEEYILEDDFLILEENGYVYVSNDGLVNVSEEIKDAFNNMETKEFKLERDRYELVCSYCDAAINLYGICSDEKIIEIINNQNNFNMDIEELKEVLDSSYLDIDYSNGFIFEKLFAFGTESFLLTEYLKNLLNKQGDKPYYVPEKNEFIKYEDVSYFEKNKEYENLYDYFYEKRNCEEELAEMICNYIHENCTRGINIDELFKKIYTLGITFNNEKEVKECFDLIIQLNNNTRMKENRGYTPAEIGRLNSTGDTKQEDSKKDKVGRNDKCPCGSGKKYKKCCGK